jgi:hypothetical protein
MAKAPDRNLLIPDTRTPPRDPQALALERILVAEEVSGGGLEAVSERLNTPETQVGKVICWGLLNQTVLPQPLLERLHNSPASQSISQQLGIHFLSQSSRGLLLTPVLTSYAEPLIPE